MEITSYTPLLFAANAAAYLALLLLLLFSKRATRTRNLLIAACAANAGSAAATAASWSGFIGPAGAAAELAGSGSWCILLLYLMRNQQQSGKAGFRVFVACGVLIGLCVLGFALAVPPRAEGGVMPLSIIGELYSRIGLAVYGLLLCENFFRNTASEFRWHVKLLCISLGSVFAYSIVLYADALLFGRLALVLWDGRAVASILAAPLLAVSAARIRNWAIDIHVSRTVVFHTATLIVSGVFLLGLAATGELIRAVGPGWGDLAEVTLVITGFFLIAVLVSSGAARSRLRRFVADNFFSHRYDYRQEWLKTTKILSANPNRVAVQRRVITAVADIADSPAGALWVRDVDVTAFHWAGSWNCPAIGASETAESAFIGSFRGGEWVIHFSESTPGPEWITDIPRAWLAVPLAHQNELIGFVVLTQPRAPVELDSETFDILRIVGRQAATHVAEQQYAQALAQARELRDYGKRFAFLVHDMKNVAGQLGMIVQNARYHRDNPEFHEDVLNTVRSALDRMNDLLKRLRPGQRRDNGVVLPMDIINDVAAQLRRTRGAEIPVEYDGRTAGVAIDPSALRSVILHLCENAIDASGDVKVRLRHEPMRIQVELVDNGQGMTPEFIRDKLFEPFGSTKNDGFGIGAYQARELIREAGGDILVSSRVGGGTTMRILLPCTPPRPLEISASPGLDAAG